MTGTNIFFRRVSTGEQIPLTPEMSIGRSEECTLRLVEGKPSRHHARLVANSNGVFIEDLQSTNGTFVDGKRLAALVKHKLAPGNRVRFDVEEFIFVVPAVKAADDPDKTQFRPVDADKTQLVNSQAPPAVRQAVNSPVAAPVAPAAAAAPIPAAPPPRPVPGPRAAPASPAQDKSADPASAPAAAGAAGAAAPAVAARGNPAGFIPDPNGSSTIFVQTKHPVTPDILAAKQLRVASPCLIVASGVSKGLTIELDATAGKKSWSIGSSADRDIRLSDEGVSAKHAKLSRRDDGSWRLEDEVSVNGILVNEMKVLSSYLGDKDLVCIGPVECVFRAPSVAAAPTARRWRRIALIAAVAFLLTLTTLFAFFRLL